VNKFICPNCAEISYTADTSQAQKCPHCTEKHVIVNSDFVDILRSYHFGNIKLTVNRRREERRSLSLPVTNDRRNSDRRRNLTTPIGWLAGQNSSIPQ